MAKKLQIKTHVQLGLRYATYVALLGVRELLKTRIVTHNPNVTGARGSALNHHKQDQNLPLRFNMRHVASRADCGTVGCIGGHIALVLGVSHPSIFVENAPPALYELFYPEIVSSSDWNNITEKMAVKAINNYLYTGRAQWHKVVPKSMLKSYWRQELANTTRHSKANPINTARLY